MKKRIKLTERDLQNIIKESVQTILKENDGVMDGVKGAWNGLKGSKGESFDGAMNNIKQGWKEGANTQNLKMTQAKPALMQKALKTMDRHLDRLQMIADKGDWVKFKDYLKAYIETCQGVMDNFNETASSGVSYND